MARHVVRGGGGGGGGGRLFILKIVVYIIMNSRNWWEYCIGLASYPVFYRKSLGGLGKRLVLALSFREIVFFPAVFCVKSISFSSKLELSMTTVAAVFKHEHYI